MPPRPRLRPISISFDAQDTLVRVVNGVEHQYRQSLLDVLHRRGISSDAMRFSHARVKAAIVAGMTEVVRADRAVFAEREAARRGCCADDVDVHEMPLGGRDRHSTEHFWSRALMQTFAHAPLYDECAPHVRDAMRLLMRDEDAWSEFTREIIYERFGTRRVWEWMPASLNALRELRAWNIGQIERAETATTTTTTADEEVCGEVIAVLAQPPVIVTNNDARIRRVVEELLQDAPLSAACSNTLSAPTPSSATTTASTHADALIGGVITCYDVPLVKPSPLGILACARAAQLDDSELCFHLHVGDAREDHVASTRAGCRFLRCDPMRGVEWEHLRDAIASMEHAMMMEHAKRC